ncbi:MAG: hypothetical protein FWG40_00770 [Peptococcaceae bacterium]|nr:hypothetical protein [Peptococcaceae bacterium]
MKRIIIFGVLLMLFGSLATVAVLTSGCSSPAHVASQRVSEAANRFEVVRELTVFNNVTGDILFIAQGRMSIDVDVAQSKLDIIVAQPGGTYEKHFVGLNETTTYIVKDLHGVEVESFRYQITINPDMLIPFDVAVVGEGDEQDD